MDYLLNHNWKAKNISYTYLMKKGCKYIDSKELFIYTFPVYKYKEYTTLFCTIVILPDKTVNINVCTNQGYSYPPFYDPNIKGYNEMLISINEEILKKFKMLHIYEEKEKRGNRKKDIKG